mmetsp:Transcript_99687/g.175659  ORF Transcript_99687/g.175659 Transcript_99687/m.175659 type:complete len:181 (+) Transcript_99687:75-617(+)
MVRMTTLVLLACVTRALGACLDLPKDPAFPEEAKAFQKDTEFLTCIQGAISKFSQKDIMAAAPSCTEEDFKGNVCENCACYEEAAKYVMPDMAGGFAKCDPTGKYHLQTEFGVCSLGHKCDGFCEPVSISSKSMALSSLSSSNRMALAGFAGAVMGALATVVAWQRFGHKAQNGYMNLEA